ncbi:MAG: ATP-binding protein [Thermodesulfobacteriota bacterium]|nr:ATP-binding protein [Thermodesulfobacteriota bacterium]
MCKDCAGKGYVTTQKGKFAKAKKCRICKVICDQCSGDGIVFQRSESGYTYAMKCECTMLEERIMLFNNARIPAQFASATLDDFHITHHTQEEARTNSRTLVNDYPVQRRGLLFMGLIGVGKTHLAAAIVRELTLEKGCRCKFIDFSHLLSDIKEGYSQGKPDKEIIELYVETPVLVIDELGKGRNTEWEADILDQIISKRYNNLNELTTIITTNYTTRDESTLHSTRTKIKVDPLISTKAKIFEEEVLKETLQQRVGDRIFSRLTEMCKMIEMEGKDFRTMKFSEDYV